MATSDSQESLNIYRHLTLNIYLLIYHPATSYFRRSGMVFKPPQYSIETRKGGSPPSPFFFLAPEITNI